MRDLKIPIIVVAFLIVLSAGLGARALYYQQRVVAPLSDLAAGIEGVRELEIVESSAGQKDVHVLLDGDVNLEDVYARLEKLAADALGASFGKLVVSDRRTDFLADVYYHLHFAIQEGISTGHFARMSEEVDERLRGLNMTRYRVFVGEEYVFVQLHQGEAYLYEVIPRPRAVSNAAQPGRRSFSLW